MASCRESLSLVHFSNIIISVASWDLEASDGENDGEPSAKMKLLHFLHSYAMEAADWADLFAVTDSPCAELACSRRVFTALSLPRSWNLMI